MALANFIGQFALKITMRRHGLTVVPVGIHFNHEEAARCFLSTDAHRISPQRVDNL